MDQRTCHERSIASTAGEPTKIVAAGHTSAREQRQVWRCSADARQHPVIDTIATANPGQIEHDDAAGSRGGSRSGNVGW